MDYKKVSQDKIRNIAIIAHVDHGKTTLVDAFMKQTHLFRENQTEMNAEQILDSGDLEREKGITIKAKNISVRYKDYKINIIDTPGHADFGGEVERTLNMADGCLLVVDAQEGVMPQTKFVLRKAFELKLTPIVVINKIDKRFANAKRALEKIQDLFLTLATEPEQLEFPVLYAIAREGKVFKTLPEGDLTDTSKLEGTLQPLFDMIVDHMPAPKDDITKPLQMQVCELDYDSHLGRYLVGRIRRGVMKKGNEVVLVKNVHPDDSDELSDGLVHTEQIMSGRIKSIFMREGLEYVEVDSAEAGEIVSISGIDAAAIGATICPKDTPEPLPDIKITPPSLKIKFEASTSPLVGKEGEFVTQKQIQQRLEKESEINIGLTITKADGGSYYVSGRGELQLSILIETLRREGYEFQIRKPEVIIRTIKGVKCEPIEEAYIDTSEEYVGVVTKELGQRKAELINIENESGNTHFTYKILTRNLIGLRNTLLNLTKGNTVINTIPIDYVPVRETVNLARKGVLISQDNGIAMGYALNAIQERGTLLIEPGKEVYEGMIIGINKYEQDIEVNPIKERHKTSVRMKRSEITLTSLQAVIPLTLEAALVFLGEDEMLEVTPKNLRLRKVLLKHTDRERAKRNAAKMQAAA